VSKSNLEKTHFTLQSVEAKNIMLKLGSKELRKLTPEDFTVQIKRNPIYLVLDEVLDTYNIGSIFRLADAIAAQKVYLCGNMDYPPSSRIHKAAVGTENWTPWEKHDSVVDVIKKLKSDNVQIIAVEQDNRAISPSSLNPTFPVAIVVGNETHGVNKEALNLADLIVELPMFGVNKSFNVWGSAAVIAYRIIEELS
jgi:23S rRNA (guanosine2251-2'-O)-methyltransferase